MPRSHELGENPAQANLGPLEQGHKYGAPPFPRSDFQAHYSTAKNNKELMNSNMGSTQESFVGSIDQGTTSSRFLIFNKAGEPVASHQLEFKQIYPQSG